MTSDWQSPCGKARLLCGDCRDVLPTLSGIDAVVTDPPYGIRHKSSYGASWEGTQIQGDDSAEIRDAVWNLFADKPRAMFGISWKVPPPPEVRAVLIWDKEHVGCGDLSVPWKPSWEEIYIGGQGWEGRRDGGVLRGPCVLTWESGPAHDGNGRKHPHEKPVWLMEHMIRKLPAAHTICDPFCGVGTTGIACLRTGRRFIGIEIDPGYFQIARERIERELAQLTLTLA